MQAVPSMTDPDPSVWRPQFRRLRVFAFDPSLGMRLDTIDINQITLEVPWETARGSDQLPPGPVGEYLEVVDYDPGSKCFYQPVDLNHPHALGQDGLAPSEIDPRFHQQMVYAVAMTTIRNFERALGRSALWSPRILKEGRDQTGEYVGRLRIYPHALREANAYYSPAKKALLFGYFPASVTDPGDSLPGGTVFTCLSHDIIAHETSHALLDGLHRRYTEPSNEDAQAFHEAFADIVALFQHFSFPEVLRHQIAKTQGDLARQNLLGKLAQQVGHATGHYGALRDALGGIDPETKQWKASEPDPTEIERTHEPHARGAILVAALFDAFVAVYKSRIADLLRIATGGTGVLPPGDIHPDLVGRMAIEAAKTARVILKMCIRALDYCPPVDIDFGDYLRALITADMDLVRDDQRGYRVAIIDAFRKRGIYPWDVRSLSEESLRWWVPPPQENEALNQLVGHTGLRPFLGVWTLLSERQQAFCKMREAAAEVHDLLTLHEKWTLTTEDYRVKAGRAIGLELGADAVPTIVRNGGRTPPVEVHSVRPARRLGPDGESQRNPL